MQMATKKKKSNCGLHQNGNELVHVSPIFRKPLLSPVVLVYQEVVYLNLGLVTYMAHSKACFYFMYYLNIKFEYQKHTLSTCQR